MKIYDNKGMTVDRYTVVMDGAVYAMSTDPNGYMGINQFSCTEGELKLKEGDKLLGARCQLADLPIEVQQAIKDRQN